MSTTNGPIREHAQQSRRWCFTIWCDRVADDWNTLDSVDASVTYMVFQQERSPTTGRLHYQGYLETQRKCGMRALFAKLGLQPGDAHFEKARGTQQQNEAYVTKEDTRVAGPWTHGARIQQGSRTDLEAYREAVLAGASDGDLVDNHYQTFARYPHLAERTRAAKYSKRTSKPFVTVIYGETGLGKSFWAYNHGPVKSVYGLPKSTGTVWWPDYQQQQRIVIDDFYGNIPIGYLLNLLDAYPLIAEVKGAHVPINSPEIVITSNIHPDQWYRNVHDSQIRALIRRFDQIIHVTDKMY